MTSEKQPDNYGDFYGNDIGTRLHSVITSLLELMPYDHEAEKYALGWLLTRKPATLVAATEGDGPNLAHFGLDYHRAAYQCLVQLAHKAISHGDGDDRLGMARRMLGINRAIDGYDDRDTMRYLCDCVQMVREDTLIDPARWDRLSAYRLLRDMLWDITTLFFEVYGHDECDGALADASEAAQRIVETIEALTPAADGRTALYRLHDAAGVLLYVGIARDPQVRWKQHWAEKWWWPQVVTRTVEWFPTRQMALDREAAAIRTERPRHNKMGVRQEDRWRADGKSERVPIPVWQRMLVSASLPAALKTVGLVVATQTDDGVVSPDRKQLAAACRMAPSEVAAHLRTMHDAGWLTPLPSQERLDVLTVPVALLVSSSSAPKLLVGAPS